MNIRLQPYISIALVSMPKFSSPGSSLYLLSSFVRPSVVETMLLSCICMHIYHGRNADRPIVFDVGPFDACLLVSRPGPSLSVCLSACLPVYRIVQSTATRKTII
uniref:Uncharacterized protein n=1 Tax=Trichobilharzia regenti TaxID=157069 RepID=A0AA85K1V0_TRIRE